MKKQPSAEYLAKAKRLPKEGVERLLSRLRSKLLRRLEDKKLDELEVVAIQMEIEDGELAEWREKMAQIRKKSKSEKSE
jgi:hypothetical protein